MVDMSSVLKPAHQMSLAAYCIPKKRCQYVLAKLYWLLPLRRKKETANPCNISPNKSLTFKRITQIDKLEFQLVKRWIPKMRHLDGFFHGPTPPRPGDLLKIASKRHWQRPVGQEKRPSRATCYNRHYLFLPFGFAENSWERWWCHKFETVKVRLGLAHLLIS